MIYFILSILLLISITINIFFGIAIKRTLIKSETYDDFFEQMRTIVSNIIKEMKDIDLRGSFQADDEVGVVFQQMKAMVDSLDVFLLKESDDAQKK